MAESRSLHASLSSNGSSHIVLLGLLCSIGTFLTYQLWRAPALLYFISGLFLLEQLIQPEGYRTTSGRRCHVCVVAN
ncbi:TPA: hypothetical protein ACH3X2_014174 [Trebouxia sp. C0005]